MSTDPVTRSNKNCVGCVSHDRVPSAGKEPRVIAERMSKALVILASCAVTLCIPLTAVAADNELYLEYSGGATYVPYQRLIGANPAPESFEGRTESDFGFNVGGAIGMRFHENFRADLQLGYHRTEVDRMPIKGQRPPAQGYTALLSVMANGYIDYDLGIGVIPYVGAGIGWGRLEIDAKNQSEFGGPLQTSVEGRDHVFTWSLMIGGTYPVNDLIDLSFGYKYIATTDADINSTGRDIGFLDEDTSPVIAIPTVYTSRRIETEYDAHEAVFAIRYKF